MIKLKTDDEIARFIRENYGIRTKSTICRYIGISVSRFNRICAKYSITVAEPEDNIKERTLDLKQLVAVRIDDKTVVYVKPGRDIEEVKEKYLNRGKV